VVTEFSREDLLAMLRSPDPGERDEVACLALVERIGSGAEDAGADALGAFGRSPRLGRDDLRGLLGTGRERMLAETGYVFRDQEEDRLGYALALILSRAELDGEDSVGWLAPVADTFADGEQGPVPASATNAMRTLRSLYLHCDRGFLFPEAARGDTPAVVRWVAHPAALRVLLSPN
jgi:hypothetical protein